MAGDAIAVRTRRYHTITEKLLAGHSLRTATIAANCMPAVAERLYEGGLPKLGLPPIKERIEKYRQEQLDEIAAQQREQIRIQSLAKHNDRSLKAQTAEQVAVQEGKILTSIRSSASKALQAVHDLTDLADALSERVRKAIQAELDVPANGALDGSSPMAADIAMDHLKQILFLQEKANKLARDAIELERLQRGEPNAAINIVQQTVHLSLPELQVRTESAVDALRRAIDQGGIELTPTRQTATIGQRIRNT